LKELLAISSRIVIILAVIYITSCFLGINKSGENRYIFSRQWSSEGDNQAISGFSPESVVITKSGEIYTGDSRNNSVQKFDSNSNFIMTW